MNQGKKDPNWMSKVIVRRSIWVGFFQEYPGATPYICAGSYEEVLEMAGEWWKRLGYIYDPDAPASEVWGKDGISASTLGGHWSKISNYQGPDTPSILIEKARLSPIKRHPDGTPIKAEKVEEPAP